MPTTLSNGVHQWYDEEGSGDPVVLLHPGGVDSRAVRPTLDGLSARFHVLAPDRRGHGRTADVDGPITYAAMADDTAALITDVVGGAAHVVGYSDGAVVALMLAVRHPDLVRRLAVVAGPFHRDGWDPSVLAAFAADEQPPEFFRTGYGEVSPDGVEHFPVVAAKLAAMHLAEPDLTTADLAAIRSRTLVMVGDDDEVRLEHAVEAYRSLPVAELAVVPGTSHGLLVEKPDLCNQLIGTFLGEEPVPTFAPIRRATGPSA